MSHQVVAYASLKILILDRSPTQPSCFAVKPIRMNGVGQEKEPAFNLLVILLGKPGQYCLPFHIAKYKRVLPKRKWQLNKDARLESSVFVEQEGGADTSYHGAEQMSITNL